jgi:predicted nucleic acid-binding protein
MREVFADTGYWVALANPRDDWHDRAIHVSRRVDRIVTTDEVLVELLNWFREMGPVLRKAAVDRVRDILEHPNIVVVQQTHPSFLSGLDLYGNRLDKQYSLADCVSMQTMKQRGLTEILTNDHHFEQERFTILLKG